jgi:hypothetical protein
MAKLTGHEAEAIPVDELKQRAVKPSKNWNTSQHWCLHGIDGTDRTLSGPWAWNFY